MERESCSNTLRANEVENRNREEAEVEPKLHREANLEGHTCHKA